jgi:hypothetical protein
VIKGLGGRPPLSVASANSLLRLDKSPDSPRPDEHGNAKTWRRMRQMQDQSALRTFAKRIPLPSIPSTKENPCSARVTRKAMVDV